MGSTSSVSGGQEITAVPKYFGRSCTYDLVCLFQDQLDLSNGANGVRIWLLLIWKRTFNIESLIMQGDLVLQA